MPRSRLKGALLLLVIAVSFAGASWYWLHVWGRPTVVELTSDAIDVAGSDNRFALDLYQQLKSQQGNLLFSPYSIATALSMTYAGASGDTRAEMAQVLNFKTPDAQVHTGNRVLHDYFGAKNRRFGVQLQVADRLWRQRGHTFLPAFLKVCERDYRSEPALVDFGGNAENVRRAINEWAAEVTDRKINEIFPSGKISKDTRLVIANAVYFKAEWMSKFDKRENTFSKFFVTPNERVDVTLMNQYEKFSYTHDENVQIVDLPYVDGSLSMLVLLPDAVDGLTALEARLTEQNLNRWLTRLSPTQLQVSLPKFQSTSQFDLNDTLSAMGMSSAFDASTADFSGMTGRKDLFLGAVLHQAYVDVNEEGTEAAAATTVRADKIAAPTPVAFRADHPFVYLIRDRESGAILFLGRMVRPPRG